MQPELSLGMDYHVSDMLSGDQTPPLPQKKKKI